MAGDMRKVAVTRVAAISYHKEIKIVLKLNKSQFIIYSSLGATSPRNATQQHFNPFWFYYDLVKTHNEYECSAGYHHVGSLSLGYNSAG